MVDGRWSMVDGRKVERSRGRMAERQFTATGLLRVRRRRA
ncbi:hypothetical protein BMA10247_0256 [Burkholderia mallei NCTC 10247]|nr:hypothetical protein BMA10247_0256 [Burkholderia mallei NCTC 10247]